MVSFPDDRSIMLRALELAEQGRGLVEPNPMVGAVIVDDQRQLLAEGWHAEFGGPHAEAEALRVAGEKSRGATLFCTLEPCAHWGKTPPCADAIIAAGIRRVVTAVSDPAPYVNGRGHKRLRAAGIEVETGLCEAEARRQIAPFVMLMTQGRPYVHAKWAMSADGKIATATGKSQWISGPESREEVHRLRGMMDAILTGIGTVLADDPLLTARPPGPRKNARIVLDSKARTPVDSQLVKSLSTGPLLIVVTSSAPQDRVKKLREAGVEVLVQEETIDARALFQELGRRRMTNILIESGSRVMGSLFDAGLVDCCHIFIAPKILGGATAPSPVAGQGIAELSDNHFQCETTRQFGSDFYLCLRHN